MCLHVSRRKHQSKTGGKLSYTSTKIGKTLAKTKGKIVQGTFSGSEATLEAYEFAQGAGKGESTVGFSHENPTFSVQPTAGALVSTKPNSFLVFRRSRATVSVRNILRRRWFFCSDTKRNFF